MDDKSDILKSLDRPVVIVGMMGAGKTTLGQELAGELDIPFTDIDRLIEKREGVSISGIFQTHGEEVFRQKEFQTICEVLKQGVGIVSVGGGAFIQEPVRELVRVHAYSLRLKVAPEEIYQRIKGETHRPLLQVDDPEGALRDLLEKREPIYAKADVSIDIPVGESVQQSCERIIKLLYSFLSNR
ncbi:MAG: shikimate kinase [Alphaproteobacteria bacterium]|nr:shikimate kinase [Alphaproteobacteria bacterium]